MWVLLYFTENALTESELCIGCSSRVEILCPVLFLHWNLKNLKKTFKTFKKPLKKPKNLRTFYFKNLVFFQLCVIVDKQDVVYSVSSAWSSRSWAFFSNNVLSTSSASSLSSCSSFCCCCCSLTARHSAIDRIMPSSWTRRPLTEPILSMSYKY